MKQMRLKTRTRLGHVSGMPKRMKPKTAGEHDSHNRYIRIGLVVVAGIVLVLCLAFFAGGGKKGGRITAQTSTATTPTTPTTTPATTPTASSAVDINAVQVPPLSIYMRRNPFEPLVDLSVATAATTTGTGPAGAGVVAVPQALAGPGDPAGKVLSREVTLEGVYEQEGKMFARVRVADQLFDKVAIGDTFGGNFKLLSLGKDSSAIIIYGDERFTVYIGQSIYW